MRIARIQTAAGPQHAVLRGRVWEHIEDPYAKVLSFTGESTPTDGAALLAPVLPGVIVGIGHNRSNTKHPLPIQAWFKSVHTLANPGDPIQPTRDAGAVLVEGELAVVIGNNAERLTRDNALDHVLGYSVVNDVTNVDQGPLDEKLFQVKSGVNYTPLGPWIETELENPEDVPINVEINGEVRARSGSFNLPSTVVECLVYVTAWTMLKPGDVVMTGAPGTSAVVCAGDRVDITLGGIGTLTNTVV